MCRHRTHYNYHALDKFLTDDSNFQELGNQLDDIMNGLVSHATHERYYQSRLEGHYYILRTLRDIFWKLKEA